MENQNLNEIVNPAIPDQFSSHLEEEVKRWQENKIIKKDQAEKILLLYQPGGEEILANKQRSRVVKIFSIMGATLVGLGIILFVASNWQGIPSFLKAIFLILTTFGMYFGGWWFKFQKQSNPKVGMALIFLGSLLFGASLILIAQSYHIRIEYSSLILLWALAIIPVAYLVRSEPNLVLSSALILFWGIFSVYEGMGIFLSQGAPNLIYLHTSFLMIAGGMIPLAYRLKLPKLQGLNTLGVLTWFGFVSSISWFEGSENPIFNVLLLLLILGGLIYGLGECHDYLNEKYQIFKENYLRLGLVVVLLTSFILTFPQIYFMYGKGYLGQSEGYSFLALVFNFILFLEICGVIYLGIRKKEEYYINYSSLFFVLLIFARYFSITWGLGARAFVFIFGGLLLIFLSYFIEKQRKRIIKSFKEEETLNGGKQF